MFKINVKLSQSLCFFVVVAQNGEFLTLYCVFAVLFTVCTVDSKLRFDGLKEL